MTARVAEEKIFDCNHHEEFEDAIDNLSSNDDSGHSSQTNVSEHSNSSPSSDEDESDRSVWKESSNWNHLEENDGLGPSLEESLIDIDRLLHMALDNRFHEAYEGTTKWAECSLYHALGRCTLSFLKGCLTLERDEIQIALENLRNSLVVCEKFKRHSSLTRYVWRPNYNNYTDVEIHSELCYAETLLMIALLTFLEDQSIMNLVRGAFRIRNCYQSYKECYYILNNRTKWSSKCSKIHFESGVRLGIGTFNLMLSHMPTKVLKLLEFVGFSGNRKHGLEELQTSAFLQNGLRRPLAVLIMLAYQCYIEHVFGLAEGDMRCVESCLDYALNKHPNGAFFLLFLGRKLQLNGEIRPAIDAFNRCIKVQNEWQQFHNICYWELLWCYSVQCDWINAADCANVLRQQCKWSPATYTYQYATFLYMIMIEQSRPELRSQISDLMREVPGLRLRFAGKTIPAEKFAIVHSQKYLNQKESLTLPTIEYMYVWNIFPIVGRSPDLLKPILELIEKNEKIEHQSKRDNLYLDDYCRCLLLKGMCLRYLKRFDESNDCFSNVIERKNHIKCDEYLVVNATLELGLNHMRMQQYNEARQWLDSAKSYSGYSLETIIHFRIHTAMRTINLIDKNGESRKNETGNLSNKNKIPKQDDLYEINNDFGQNDRNSSDLILNKNEENLPNKGERWTLWNELSKRFTIQSDN
ncbi:hypothetical protein NH340_JMT03989 [Sarcoptes scabiei]|nr:hypothetical protein NH340_JMT03989 [Sarcoptes scabiei]